MQRRFCLQNEAVTISDKIIETLETVLIDTTNKKNRLSYKMDYYYTFIIICLLLLITAINCYYIKILLK